MPPICFTSSNSSLNEYAPDLQSENSVDLDFASLDASSSYLNSSNQSSLNTKPMRNKSLDPVHLLKETLKKVRQHDCKIQSSQDCSQLIDQIAILIPEVIKQIKPAGLNGPPSGVHTFSKGPITTDLGASAALFALFMGLSAIISGCDSEIDTPILEFIKPPSDVTSWNDLNKEDTIQAPDSLVVAQETGNEDADADINELPTCSKIETACDGIDEDCDGFTDNLPDINNACQILANDCLLIGLNKCFPEKGPDLTCEIPQQNETICNGVDDDCDGKTDDGFNTGDSCSVGIGACNNNGEFVCATDHSSTVCKAVPLPPAEAVETLCNGIDDDCNGTTDLNANGTPLTRSIGEYNLGECHTGTEICKGNNWTILNAQADPQPETCDGLDNDCNGKTDVNPDGTPLTRPYGEYSLGECHTGIEICTNKNWIILNDKADPQKETCDGADNDCDGFTDNGFNIGTSCTMGLGACENSGNFICSPDHSSTICTAVPLDPIETVETLCNSLDDDCDGTTDQNADGSPLSQLFGDYKLGECKQGTNICTDGNWIIGLNKIDPTPELCDGLDNDCDGLIDNNTPDSDEDNFCDTLDNCPTVANPDQEPGDAPNGLACTPQCSLESTNVNLHAGDLTTLPFQIKAGETLICNEANYLLDPNSNSYDFTVGPYLEVGLQTLDCQMTGFNKTIDCPSVTINVTNETPQIDSLTITQKQAQAPNVLTPDNFAINWTASDADGAGDIQSYDVNLTRQDNQGNPVVVTNCTGLTVNSLNAGDLLSDKCSTTPLGYGEMISPFMLGANQDYNVTVMVRDQSNAIQSATADFSLGDIGQVGRWRFEGDLKDTSGQSTNAGILHGDNDSDPLNNFELQNNLLGNALNLNLNNDYVSITDNSGKNLYNLGTGDFTISLWYQGDINISKNDSSKGFEIGTKAGSETPFFYTQNCGIMTAGVPPLLKGWNQFIITRADNKVKIYLNGELAGVQDCSDDLTNNVNLLLGCSSPASTGCAQDAAAKVDELVLYNRALSVDEVITQCRAHDPTGTTCIK